MIEIDLAWLLALPIVFGLGWIVARYDRGQQRRESRQLPRDVLDGMSSVLGDDLSAATDSLLKAARLAPDACDLHRAVGNLYRRRGMTDRAIEVHETALRNPSLTPSEREKMTLDLGRDYMAAGIFDRAQETLQGLLSGSILVSRSARALLLTLTQRTRQWQQALELAQAIQDAGEPFAQGQTHAQLTGHFYCELAQEAIKAQDWAKALGYLNRAQAFDAPGPKLRIQGLQAEIASLQNTAQIAQAGSTAFADEAYICKSCGFRTRQPLWQCPGCHRWDSFGVMK